MQGLPFSLPFGFTFPAALLLFLFCLPFVVYRGRRVRSLGGVQRGISMLLRLVIVVCVVLALAGLEMVRERDDLTVFFVLDRSDSIPREQQKYALNFIERAADEMQANDLAGLLVFAENVSIELAPNRDFQLETILSDTKNDNTNIGDALRLAAAAFPERTQKRMVLISDGNETQGSALEQARLARGNGTVIDVLPVTFEYDREVMIEELVVPERVDKEEPFEVRIVVRAFQDAPGVLRLFESGRLVAEQDVSLSRGKNIFVVPRSLVQAGFHTYEATVDCRYDTNRENNRGHGFVAVRGEPKVLYVEGESDEGADLVRALETERITVELRNLTGLPTTITDLQRYDTVILSEVAASDFSVRQMELIEANVKELGGGLIMLGGSEGFGAGGYLGTPVERALPVEMDISQKKIVPSGALVLIMHTCEMPQANAWARDIAIAAIEVLSSKDKAGVLLYDTGERWLFPIQEVGNKVQMYNLINTMRPGDMPSFDTTLNMAYKGLSECNAGLKHIVIISDGDPAQPTPALVQKLAAAKITISTVCIKPHSPRDTQTMQAVAAQGNGRSYKVESPNELPRIFIKEASVVRKSLIFEEPFVPKQTHFSEMLSGFEETELPELKGYVCTSAKDRAEMPLVSNKDDPVLAHWRYGLGKSVAFTSDAKRRWAADWVNWEGFTKFWAQVVRWTMRSVSETDFQVATDIRDGQGVVTVDAVSDDGTFVNFLSLGGRVLTPALDADPLEFEQTAAGRYEARFRAKDVGTYLVNLDYESEDGAGGTSTTGAAVSYSEEYRRFKTNEKLLDEIASITKGRVLDSPRDVFLHTGTTLAAPRRMSPWLLALAVLLFPLDIFIRRIVIEATRIRAAAAAVAGRMAILRRFVRPPEPVPEVGTVPGVARTAGRTVQGHPGVAPGEAAEVLTGDVTPAEERNGVKEPVPEDEPVLYTKQLLAAKKRALKGKSKREDRNGR